MKGPYYLCLIINHDHYRIPLGKADESSKGDHYFHPRTSIGAGWSFHASGKAHYKDRFGEIPVDPQAELPSVIEGLEALREDVGDDIATEFMRITMKNYSFKGCFVQGCENYDGICINYSRLLEDICHLKNKHFALLSSIESEDLEPPEEDKDEIDLRLDMLREKGMLLDEEVGPCPECGDEDRLEIRDGRYVVRECKACGGSGLNMGRMRAYLEE